MQIAMHQVVGSHTAGIWLMQGSDSAGDHPSIEGARFIQQHIIKKLNCHAFQMEEEWKLLLQCEVPNGNLLCQAPNLEVVT